MGVFALGPAATGKTTSAPGAQLASGRALGAAFDRVLAGLEPVPEPVLGAGPLALAAVFVVAGLRDRQPAERKPCHDHRHDAAAGVGQAPR